MTKTKDDPLLGFAQLLIGLFRVATGAITIAMPLAIFALFASQDWLLAELGPDHAPLAQINAAITALLVGFAILGAAAFTFFGRLASIVKTVERGVPFAAENAERLAQMAWLTLGIQALGMALEFLVEFIRAQFPGRNLDIDIEFSLEGLLMMLVLFILARVFRKGAEMRDDLEGTV